MSEQLNTSPYQYLFERFCNDDSERQEYQTRGLLPTNNLSVYFLAESEKEWGPDFPSPHDYRHKPFAVPMQMFRDDHPDMWQEARDATEAAARAFTVWSQNRTPELEAAATEAKWHKAEVMTRVFINLEPELKKEGINPVSVCV